MSSGSVEERVRYARSFLYQAYLEDDTLLGKRLLIEFGKSVEKDSVVFLMPDETFLYSYWLDCYAIAEQTAVKIDSIVRFFKQGKRIPGMRNFYKMAGNIALKRERIYRKMNETRYLDSEDRFFHILNFDELISHVDWHDSIADNLNLRKAAFLESFPESKYVDFVKKYIGAEFKESNISFGVELFTGTGFYSGTLMEVIQPYFEIGSRVRVGWKRIGVELWDRLGYSKTLNDIQRANGIWPKNSPYRLFNFGILAGYDVISRTEIRLFIYTGVTTVSVFRPWGSSSPDDRYKGLDFSAAPAVGLSISFLNRAVNNGKVLWEGLDLRYFRIGYSYTYLGRDKVNAIYNGSMHNVTFGYQFYNRPRVRIK